MHYLLENYSPARREFLRKILYNNIAIIAIQHRKFLNFQIQKIPKFSNLENS